MQWQILFGRYFDEHLHVDTINNDLQRTSLWLMKCVSWYQFFLFQQHTMHWSTFTYVLSYRSALKSFINAVPNGSVVDSSILSFLTSEYVAASILESKNQQ